MHVMSERNSSHQDPILAVQLQILAGKSGQPSWRFTSKYPNSRISVGSDAYCHWQLESNGVAPVHFELSWDGQILWISDVAKPDAVFLNGQPVSGWTQVVDGSRVRFGGAELAVASMHVLDSDRPDAAGEFPSEATQFVQMPPGPAQAARPQAQGQPPPRMLSAHTVVVRADQAPAMGTAPAPAPRTTRPTVQTAVPDLKRYGLHEAKTMLNNPSAPVPMPAPNPPAPNPPAPLAAPENHKAEAFPKRNSMFMYPPALPAKDESDKEEPWTKERFKQEARLVLGKIKARLKTLDLKTWVILGATLAMATMFFLDQDEPPQRPPPVAPARQIPDSETQTKVLPQAELLEAKDVAQAERDAASFYTTGSYREAHALYRRLARTLPDQRVFSMMVDVLERRLEQRCAEQGGSACD